MLSKPNLAAVKTKAANLSFKITEAVAAVVLLESIAVMDIRKPPQQIA